MLTRHLVLALVATSSAQAAVFMPLDRPLASSRFSTALAVSSNGEHVLGNFITEQPEELILPTLWDSNGMAQPLATTLSSGLYGIFSIAVTDDGQTVFAEDDDGNTLVWKASTGFAPFEAFAFADQTIINGINADGTWLVGSTSAGPSQPFSESYRWSVEDGLTLLGQLPGGQVLSHANAVSEDGSVVVGYAASTGGDQAFRWTEEAGIVGLGRLDDGQVEDGRGFSWATAISADGRVIGGASSYLGGSLPWQAFLWTENTGMQPLEFLAGFNNANVGGLSSDGRIAVGGQSALAFDLGGSPDPVAYVWDAANGLQNLQQLLVEEFGLAEQLEGWHLEQATDISADGLTIVGEAENPEGRRQGWAVRLDRRIDVPEPSTVVITLLLLCGFGVADYRSRTSHSLGA